MKKALTARRGIFYCILEFKSPEIFVLTRIEAVNHI